MEDAVHEAYARALVWVLIGYFDVDLPVAASEGGCGVPLVAVVLHGLALIMNRSDGICTYFLLDP